MMLKTKINSKLQISIIINLFLKVFGILLTFLIYSLSYKLLKSEVVYGLWLVMLGVINWLTIFDLGLGNGLRNKLTSELAKHNTLNAKKYISTAYTIIFFITSLLIMSLLFINNFVNFAQLLNASEIKNFNIIFISTLIILIFNLNFKLIEATAYANQDAYIPSIIVTSANVFIILLLVIGITFKINEFIYICLGYGIVYLLIYFSFNLSLFKWKYKNLQPKLSLFKKEFVRDLFSLGIKVFIIQLATIFVLFSDTVMISSFLGPRYVPEYQITNKLFSVALIFSTVIMTPLWSAITKNYEEGNVGWINSIKKKLIKLFFLLVIIILGIAFFSQKIIQVWMGPNFSINNDTILFMGLLTITLIWINIFAYILNGLSKFNLQLITMVIAAIVNIPLSYYLSVILGLNLNGIILASITSLLPFAILGPLEVKIILKRVD